MHRTCLNNLPVIIKRLWHEEKPRYQNMISEIKQELYSQKKSDLVMHVLTEIFRSEWKTLNSKGTVWIFLNGSDSKPCHSHWYPVSRRINIGSRYQAEVPELRQRAAVELDQHKAELVWAPLAELEEKPDFQEKGKKSALFHICCITWNWN